MWYSVLTFEGVGVLGLWCSGLDGFGVLCSSFLLCFKLGFPVMV